MSNMPDIMWIHETWDYVSDVDLHQDDLTKYHHDDRYQAVVKERDALREAMEKINKSAIQEINVLSKKGITGGHLIFRHLRNKEISDKALKIGDRDE